MTRTEGAGAGAADIEGKEEKEEEETVGGRSVAAVQAQVRDTGPIPGPLHGLEVRLRSETDGGREDKNLEGGATVSCPAPDLPALVR